MPTPNPPSSRMRADVSTPRRRYSDPMPRRREIDHKPANSSFGSLAIITVAVLFIGYVFNIAGFATKADSFFNTLNSSAQGKRDLAVHVMTLLYPALGMLFAALVIFGVLRALLSGVMRSRKRRALAGRDVITLETFKRLTNAHGVRPRIATQAYELMLPYYRDIMRARLDDRLIEDLHMRPVQVQEVYADLLRRTDRKAPVNEMPVLITVMDLLNAVQNATRQSLMNSVEHPTEPGPGLSRTPNTPTETRREIASR